MEIKYINLFKIKYIIMFHSQNNFDNSYKNFKLIFNPQEASLQNIKYFLESYKPSKDSTLISKKFIEECPLYTEESQIPENYEFLKNTFDRNLVFYIRHGPNRNRNHYHYNIPKNYYPKVPLVLSPSCPLVLKINKDESTTNFENNLFDKIWNLKFYYDDNEFDYGPYNSNYIYEFIKNYYDGLNKDEKKSFNLLIIDYMSDIHYQPDALYQMFEDEIKKGKIDKAEQTDNENNKKDNSEVKK